MGPFYLRTAGRVVENLSLLAVKLEGKKQQQEIKLQCVAKPHQSILQNPMAKKYEHFQRTNQKSSQTIHRKIFMSSKKITIEQFLQISVHTDMKSTKKAIFEQTPQNQSIRGQITFGIQLQTFPSKSNTRKLQSKT